MHVLTWLLTIKLAAISEIVFLSFPIISFFFRFYILVRKRSMQFWEIHLAMIFLFGNVFFLFCTILIDICSNTKETYSDETINLFFVNAACFVQQVKFYFNKVIQLTKQIFCFLDKVIRRNVFPLLRIKKKPLFHAE